jgi:2-haloacid dehalogenase
MERFLTEIGFDEWNRLQDAGRPFSVAVAELCARHPQHCDLIRAYDERFQESIKGAIPGTVDILRSLWTMGISLFGFTNWPAEKFYLVRPQYEFLGWFQGIIISGEEGLAKPDPRIFQVLLRQVDRPAGECLLIDDSPTNIATAQSLGFQAIYFHSPPQLAGELVRRGLLPETQL